MSLSIMVIDDEFDLQQAVRGILEDEGFEVLACSSGREALECLKTSVPNLILLDIMMPFMSGYEVLERLGQMDAIRDVPVIMMSAVEPGRDGTRLEARAFLKKPFRMEKLLTAVRGNLRT